MTRISVVLETDDNSQMRTWYLDYPDSPFGNLSNPFSDLTNRIEASVNINSALFKAKVGTSVGR